MQRATSKNSTIHVRLEKIARINFQAEEKPHKFCFQPLKVFGSKSLQISIKLDAARLKNIFHPPTFFKLAQKV